MGLTLFLNQFQAQRLEELGKREDAAEGVMVGADVVLVVAVLVEEALDLGEEVWAAEVLGAALEVPT